MKNRLGRTKRAVWKIPTQPSKEAHFAIFPEKLIETPIKAGCPEFICEKCGKAREKIFKTDYKWQTKSKTMGKKQSSGEMATIPGHANKIVIENGWKECLCKAGFSPGIILDPFFGSGTTGLVALKNNRNFIGIEMNSEYIKIAEKRLAPFLQQTKLK